MIGAQWALNDATRLFMGDMDDVRLYNRALSAAEIASLAGSNSAPVANNDSYSTDVNTVLNIPAPGVLDNDTDADGDPLTATLVTDVAHEYRLHGSRQLHL